MTKNIAPINELAKEKSAIDKSGVLHTRNRHKHGYDFSALCEVHPALTDFVITNPHVKIAAKSKTDILAAPSAALTIDFSDASAVKQLNAALLKQHYKISFWDIPEHYLCPPIPGRVDYIHYLADLLKNTNANELPRSKNITVLDVGMGASCIYPILGKQVYQWRFVGSDIDATSIENAQEIINKNEGLADSIDCRLQSNVDDIFAGIIQSDELYDLTMCNPPFHRSKTEATRGSQRKWQNLNKNTVTNNNDVQEVNLNFGGQNAELWCAGGELAFIRKIINESRFYQQQVLWFTCLVSKKDNLSAIKQSLKKAKVAEFTVINMAQGQKTSRFIAWSYLNKEQQQSWCQSRF